MRIVSDLDLNNQKIKNFRLESLSSSTQSESSAYGRLWIEKVQVEDNSEITEFSAVKVKTEQDSPILLDSKTWGNFTSESSIKLKTLRILGEDKSFSPETGALVVNGDMGVGGQINANSVSGAVWNDYAEYREIEEEVAPGYCVCELGNGKVKKTSRRLQKLPMIVSDTFGFSIGKINETDVPIAVCGRVLAYTDKPISKFRIGDWVCTGKNGKVSKMNFIERLLFPDRKVGIVSSFPSQETWGSGKVSTKDRIWIRI